MITVNKDKLSALLSGRTHDQTIELLRIYDESPLMPKHKLDNEGRLLDIGSIVYLHTLMERPVRTTVLEYNEAVGVGDYMRKVCFAQRVSEEMDTTLAMNLVYPERSVQGMVAKCLDRINKIAERFTIKGFAAAPLLIQLFHSAVFVRQFVVFTPCIVDSKEALESGLAQPLEMCTPEEMARAQALWGKQ